MSRPRIFRNPKGVWVVATPHLVFPGMAEMIGTGSFDEAYQAVCRWWREWLEFMPTNGMVN